MPVDAGRRRSANVVDNLGSTRPPFPNPRVRRPSATRWPGPRRRYKCELPCHELRLLVNCGKERTGFPQVGGADLFEIHHPVDPETWKRDCAII